MPRRNDPIVIKRVEDDGHHEGHGGGWKVAYADFMTAMMAFFLLLWILAASDDEKLQGLAQYFTPSLSESQGGGSGLLDGSVIGPEGILSGAEGEAAAEALPNFGQTNPLAVFDSRLREAQPRVVVEYEPAPGEEAAAPADAIEKAARQAELEQARAERQSEMEAIEDRILGRISGDSQLQDFTDNLRFDRTPEGLDVQILDKDGQSMFATGSSRIADRTRELIRVIGEAMLDLPHTLSISGHTDTVPFQGAGSYSNWELSADRANATRRVLVDTGINPARITRISGLADTVPLDPDHPDAAENRRISVTINYPDPAGGETAAPEAQGR